MLEQMLLDHLERPEPIPLRSEHEPEPVHVLAAVLAVSRRAALGGDQPLGLEVVKLRMRQIGELVPQHLEHLTDAEPRGNGGARPARSGGRHQIVLPVERVIGQAVLADWTSWPAWRRASSTRSLPTYVPFSEPRSRTRKPSPSRTNAACLRETVTSSRKISLFGVTSRDGGLGVEQEARPQVRTLLDDQQRTARRQVLDRSAILGRETGLGLLQGIAGRDRAQLRRVVEIIVVPLGVPGHRAPLPGLRRTLGDDRTGFGSPIFACDQPLRGPSGRCSVKN